MDRAYLRARLDRSFEESYDVFPMISLTNSAENESRPGERDFDNLSGTVSQGLLVSRFLCVHSNQNSKTVNDRKNT